MLSKHRMLLTWPRRAQVGKLSMLERRPDLGASTACYYPRPNTPEDLGQQSSNSSNLAESSREQAFSLDRRNVMILARRGYALEARVNQNAKTVFLCRCPFHQHKEGKFMIYRAEHPSTSFSWDERYDPSRDRTVADEEQLSKDDFVSVALPERSIANIYDEL